MVRALPQCPFTHHQLFSMFVMAFSLAPRRWLLCVSCRCRSSPNPPALLRMSPASASHTPLHPLPSACDPISISSTSDTQLIAFINPYSLSFPPPFHHTETRGGYPREPGAPGLLHLRGGGLGRLFYHPDSFPAALRRHKGREGGREGRMRKSWKRTVILWGKQQQHASRRDIKRGSRVMQGRGERRREGR